METFLLVSLLVVILLLYFILKKLREVLKYVEAINICFGLQSFSKTLNWSENRPGRKLNKENEKSK